MQDEEREKRKIINHKQFCPVFVLLLCINIVSISGTWECLDKDYVLVDWYVCEVKLTQRDVKTNILLRKRVDWEFCCFPSCTWFSFFLVIFPSITVKDWLISHLCVRRVETCNSFANFSRWSREKFLRNPIKKEENVIRLIHSNLHGILVKFPIIRRLNSKTFFSSRPNFFLLCFFSSPFNQIESTRWSIWLNKRFSSFK